MLKRYIVRILMLSLLGSLALLGGCSTASLGVNESEKLELNPDGDDGLMVISVRWISPYKRSNFMPALMRKPARTLNEKMRPALNVKNAFIKPDFTDPPGYFYTMKLASGTYEISSPIMPTPVRLEVPAGKIVYVGEIEFHHKLGCNQVSGPGCKPNSNNYVVHKVKNQWPRDKMLLQQRLTDVRPDTVAIRLARPAK